MIILTDTYGSVSLSFLMLLVRVYQFDPGISTCTE